jgi:ribosomal protein L37AE/L43A
MRIKDRLIDEFESLTPARIKPICPRCGNAFSVARWDAGYHICMDCGEAEARLVRHTVVPMPKSNYILVTDPSLLVGLNSSHKGNR